MSKLKNLKASVTLFILFCAAWMRKLTFRSWEMLVPRNWFTVSTGHEGRSDLVVLVSAWSPPSSPAGGGWWILDFTPIIPALPPERDSLYLFHQRFSNYKNSTQALSCKHLHEIFFSYRHLKGKYSFTIDAETPMRDFLFDFVQRELFFLSSWFERLQTSVCSTAHFNEQLWIFLRNTFAVAGYKIWLLGISQESGSFAALRLIWQGWARAPCLSTGCTSDLEDKHGVEAEDTHTRKTHTALSAALLVSTSSVIQTQNTRNSTENTRGTFHTGSFSRAKLAQHVQPECHVTRNSVCGASTCSGSLTHAGRTWRLRLQVNGLWSPEQEKVKETRTRSDTSRLLYEQHPPSCKCPHQPQCGHGTRH